MTRAEVLRNTGHACDNRGVRNLVLLVVVAIACRHEPVLNPDNAAPRTKTKQVDKAQQVAPDGIMVQTQDGKPIDLATLWRAQRVVVVFYRGHWCPHCKHQLGELEKRRVEVGNLGATVVAVSSDSPADAAALRQQLGLGFQLYADPQLAMITRWGVDDYQNGISLPATFVVEVGGAISYRRVGAAPSDHPSMDELLAALKR